MIGCRYFLLLTLRRFDAKKRMLCNLSPKKPNPLRHLSSLSSSSTRSTQDDEVRRSFLDGTLLLDSRGENPFSAHLKRLTERLFPHQIAAIEGMEYLEKNREWLWTLPFGEYGEECDVFSSSVGIMALPTGAGKTYVSIFLSMARPWISDSRDRPTQSDFVFPKYSIGMNNKYIPFANHFKKVSYLFNTLIVIPADMKTQWERDLRHDGILFLTNFNAKSQKAMKSEAYARRTGGGFEHDVVEYNSRGKKIIVMTSTAYNEYHSSKNASVFDACGFQRLLIDEATTIDIPVSKFPSVRFMWAVTATPSDLAKSKMSKLFVPTMQSMKTMRTVKKMCDKDLQTHIGRFFESIIVSCDPWFVRASITLPPPQRTTVYYVQTRLMMALQSAMPANAIKAVEAGDVTEAIKLVRCASVETGEGLVAAVTKKIDEDIESCRDDIARSKVMLDSAVPGGAMQHMDEEEKNSYRETIQTCLRTVAELEHKKKCITERIQRDAEAIRRVNAHLENGDDIDEDEEEDGDGLCKISFQPIKTPCYTLCCSSVFELKSIMYSLDKSGTCPICRKAISMQDTVTLHTHKGEERDAKRQKRAPEAWGTINRPYEKGIWDAVTGTMCSIFEENPEAKVLVFNAYDLTATKHEISRILQEKSLGCEARVLEGSYTVIHKILDAFRQGSSVGKATHVPPLRVLLLDAVKYGAGHNIECATHVIMFPSMKSQTRVQAEGRAQRLGRTTPLRVINLVNKNGRV